MIDPACGYGAAVLQNVNGQPVVVEADEVIGIAVELLVNGADLLPVDGDGCILLGRDPQYRYRPVRFEGRTPGVGWPSPVAVLVCERVRVADDDSGLVHNVTSVRSG